MTFLDDKIIEGEYVVLRHVTPDDTEAILAAWHTEPSKRTEVQTLLHDARIVLAHAFAYVADHLHPYAHAKFCGPQVSSTWRHHRPPTPQQEREILRRLELDEDRYQYLMTRKGTSDIIGCIGFKTNRLQKDGLTENCLENLRVAQLGMLLFREDPWDHQCEREAIRLILKKIFMQKFKRGDGTHFRVVDVVVPVNMEDDVALGVLMSLGFKETTSSFTYHGRTTRILDYFPPEDKDDD